MVDIYLYALAILLCSLELNVLILLLVSKNWGLLPHALLYHHHHHHHHHHHRALYNMCSREIFVISSENQSTRHTFRK